LKILYWLFTTIVGAMVIGLSIFYLNGMPNLKIGLGADKGAIEVVDSNTFHQVLLVRDVYTDDLTVTLSFPYGEAHNRYAEGLAHYTEHLAFLNAFFGATDAADRQAHSNAQTTKFTTSYWLHSSPNDLNKTITDLLRVADPIELEQSFAHEERGIVLREYEWRVAEDAWYPLWDELEREIHDHGPLARSVIGRPDDIARYSYDDAKALHDATHKLSDATLIVYGNVTKERLEGIFQRLTPPLVMPDTRKRAEIFPADLDPIEDTSSMTSTRVVSDGLMYMTYAPVPKCGSMAACDLLAWLALWVLDSPMEGGLAGPLRFDDFLARDFRVDVNMIGPSHAMIEFGAAPDKGATLDDIDKGLKQVLNTAFVSGVPEASFDRAKKLLGEYLETFDYPEYYNSDQTTVLLSRGAEVYSYKEEVQALDAIELQDLNAFLAEFSNDSRSLTRYVHMN